MYQYTGSVPKPVLNRSFNTYNSAKVYLANAKEIWPNIIEGEIFYNNIYKHISRPKHVPLIGEIFELYRELKPTDYNNHNLWFNDEFDRLYDMPLLRLISLAEGLNKVVYDLNEAGV